MVRWAIKPSIQLTYISKYPKPGRSGNTLQKQSQITIRNLISLRILISLRMPFSLRFSSYVLHVELSRIGFSVMSRIGAITSFLTHTLLTPLWLQPSTKCPSFLHLECLRSFLSKSTKWLTSKLLPPTKVTKLENSPLSLILKRIRA